MTQDTQSTRKRKTRSRPNGTGTAVKRGKTWTAVVVVDWKASKDRSHKIPIYKTKGGFQTKKDALNYCPVLLNQKSPERKVPNLLHYWTQYENGDLPKLSRDKQYAYKGAWKKLESLQYRLVDSITVSDLRSVVADKAKTYYPARDMKVVLSHLFALAGADGFVNKDLPSYIVLPDLTEKERTPFTEQEQKSLWKVYEKGDRRAAIPLIMIYTGMMPGEMQQMKREYIHIDDQNIVGVGMKTKIRKQSPVYLPDIIVPVIIDELAASDLSSEYVWKHDEKAFYRDYYAVLEKAKCRRLEPYSCRHTTATALAITEGIAPQTVKKVMRWSSTRMLDRYAHPDTTDAIDALNTLKK